MDKTQKINARFYDENAKRWSKLHSDSFVHEKPFKRLLKRLPRNARVIDVGCASGIHVPLFLGIGRGTRYEGLDISNQFLKLARGRYPQLKFSRGNLLEQKTLPRKRYDAFWAAAILQHVPKKDWGTMLTNLEKLTKKGGLGYITVPETRPNPASRKDQRYFELFNDVKFREMIEPRGWRAMAHGELRGRTGQTVWRWYIVQLP